MVTYTTYKPTASGAYVEGVCLSSDTPPVEGIANGSILYEVNASNASVTKLMFDQAGAQWIAVHTAEFVPDEEVV